MRAIEALQAGKGKPGRHADGCNLYARVSPARTKKANWIFTYKRPGAKSAKEITLGPVKVKTVDAIRARAAKMFEAWKEGRDPASDIAAEEARKAAVRSVWAVVDKFLADSAGKRKAKQQATAKSALERYLAPIANVDHEAVTVNQIEDVLRPVIMAKPVEGRVAAQRLVAAFKHSGRADNPAEVAFDRLKNVLPAHRAASLPAMAKEDLPTFWAQLTAIDTPAARCLAFQILTGARPGEARGLNLAEVDRTARTWTLPPERHKTGGKSGEEVVKGLCDAALALLPPDVERPFAEVSEKAV
ncbi:MAG TPA: integrase family protein, partial [Roseiarcus sp.]